MTSDQPAFRDRVTLAVDAISHALKHLLVVLLENVMSTAATASLAAHARIEALAMRVQALEASDTWQRDQLMAVHDDLMRIERHLQEQDTARQALHADVQRIVGQERQV